MSAGTEQDPTPRGSRWRALWFYIAAAVLCIPATWMIGSDLQAWIDLDWGTATTTTGVPRYRYQLIGFWSSMGAMMLLPLMLLAGIFTWLWCRRRGGGAPVHLVGWSLVVLEILVATIINLVRYAPYHV